MAKSKKQPKKRTKKTNVTNKQNKIPTNVKKALYKNYSIYQIAGDKRIPKPQRNKIIDTMNDSQVNLISNVFKKIVSRRYKLPNEVIALLRKNEKYIRKLLNGNNLSCAGKKTILKQSGGILPLLIGKMALPLLGNLLGGLFGK